jgi:hypothetical protein
MNSPAAIRKALREDIAALLRDIPALGTVQTGRHYLPHEDECPLTRVRTPVSTPQDDNADETDFDITLEILHYAAAPDIPAAGQPNIDDLLDAASGLIYQAIYQNGYQSLNGAIYNITPGPQVQTIDDETEINLGLALETYTLSVIYPKDQPQ